MTTTPTTRTFTITENQTGILNNLASANDSLSGALTHLAARVKEQQERVSAGHSLVGFGSDLLGQPNREVQHYGSVREALIQAAVTSGIDVRVVSHALGYDVESRYRRARYFTVGQTVTVETELEA